MDKEEQQLLLKRGTIKGFDGAEVGTPFRAALDRYFAAGDVAAGAMQQHDNDKQKSALCDVIDSCAGTILNDRAGSPMTKEEAKAYVLNYRK